MQIQVFGLADGKSQAVAQGELVAGDALNIAHVHQIALMGADKGRGGKLLLQFIEWDSELPVFAGRHMEAALVPVHLDMQDVSRVKRQKLASQIQQDLAGLMFFQEDIKGIGDLVVLESSYPVL